MGPPPGVEADQLQLRNRQHEIVADLGRRALSGDDPGWLMHDAAAALAETLDLDYAGVFELAPDEQRLVLREGVGWRKGEGRVGDPAEPGHLSGAVLGEGEPVVFGEGDEPVPLSDRLVHHEVTSGIAVPLAPAGEPRGMLAAYAEEDRSFTDADVDFVQSIANVIASSLETETAPIGEAETRHEVELQESERYRQKLDDIMTAPQLDGDEKIQRLLELGCERLGVENGHLVRIDVEAGRHEVVQAAGTTLVEAGSVTDLEETYCRETVGSGDVTEVPNVPEGGWAGDPAYERWGIGCYIGTEVRVEGEPWGTLCFVNGEPIDEPLTEAQRAFVNLMGRWIGREMERREHTRRIREEKERFASLVQEVGEYAIFTLDRGGKVRSWNRGAQEIKGYTESEILGRSFQTFYTEEDREAGVPERNLATAAEYGSIQDEGWRVRADGSRFWANVTITALHDDEGEISGFAKVTRDMTERRNREREVEKSERRHRTLVENFPNGAVALYDHDLRYTVVGGQLLDDLGFDPDEIVGQSVLERYSSDVLDVAEANFRAALEGDANRFEIGYHGRHLLAHTMPVRDAGDEVYAGMLVVQDITERKRAEERLRESEVLYRTMAENFPDGGVGVFDEDLRYTLVEGTMWDDIEPDAEDLEGNTIFEALPEETVADIEGIFRGALDGEKGTTVSQLGGRTYRVWAAPLRDREGEITGGLSFAVDLTDQLERQRALEESRQRYRTLVENFPNGAVALVDEDLVYRMVGGTPPAGVGASPESIQGQLVADALPGDLADELVDRYERAFEGEASSFEHDIGEEVYRFRIVPVRDAQGEVFAAMGMSQDITEAKERERQLEESNERLEQFAYAASHDLQEPLRMVSSYLQLIESRYGQHLDEEGREFFSYAVDGAQRMRAMIKSLLQYSRIRTEGQPLEPTDSQAVLDDVLSDLQLRIEETDAEVTADALPVVRADPDQLGQVFRNLISNALKYSGDEPPRVHVGAERVADKWRFSIHDEGIGIADEHTDQIFEVFRRLEGSDDGTGIGLAICEQIVGRHGGRMWVDSTPGEGSTFHFTMPAVDGDAA